MKQSAVVLILAMALVVYGCAGLHGPTVPGSSEDLTITNSLNSNEVQTHLWGYYDVYIDVENQSVTAVPNRDIVFNANVVNFINGNPANLKFQILETPIGTDYIDVDINVSIQHPFSGLPQYNGYDVRGIFYGDASSSLQYNPSLEYAVFGNDQFMFDDPEASGTNPSVDYLGGGPDGYSRWYNRVEFQLPGLFGYTHGKFASGGFDGNATLNPYKYFADDLGPEDDAWEFLNLTDGNGIFSSGSLNTRNYYLRFPNTAGIQYGYGVVASWEAEDVHPANMSEAPLLNVTDSSNLFYVDDTTKGGDIKLDLDVFGWNYQPSTIFFESPVVTGGSMEIPDMTPTGGTDRYSTYHFEITPDNISSNEDSEYWVICEYSGLNYSNPYDVPNDAQTDPLAAFFRCELPISDTPSNLNPVCDITWDESVTFPYTGGPVCVQFDASGSYDPDPGDIISFEWDFNGDLVFGDAYEDGTDDMPMKVFDASFTGDVSVKVSDDKGGASMCAIEGFDVTIPQTKNITLRSGVDAMDIGVDHADGDLLILYSDGQVWKYTEAANYLTGTFLANSTAGVDHIDVSHNSYFNVGGSTDETVQFCRSFTPTGTMLGAYWVPDGCYEVFTYNSPSTSLYNYHSRITGPTYYTYGFWIVYKAPPTYGPGSGQNRYDGYGENMLHHTLIRGVETSQVNDYIYVLEDDPEFRVERQYYNMSYSNVNWGGTQSDGMDGFNDPRDITRDDNNDFYILDYLSTGEPLVKKYSDSGTSIGSFGNSENISGDPLKIEGSDYNGNIFVLHSDGLSYFTPCEMG